MQRELLIELLKMLMESPTPANPPRTPSDSCEYPFSVGCAYFIRAVTYHWTGRVVGIIGKFLILDDAAWIADSGRFMNAIKEGKLSEVEPVGDGVIINVDTIVDAIPWVHELPMKQQ